MIRIKQTIQDKRNGREVKAYIRDDSGMIKVFDTVQEAKEYIQYLEYCNISNIKYQYKITGV